MQNDTILLKSSPRVEFKLLDNCFQIIDERDEGKSGYYSYRDLTSIELRNLWFPTVAKWLRVITWIFNGVPLFPDAESCKKSSVILQFRERKLGIWLSDRQMAQKARSLKQKFDERSSLTNLRTSVF